jgi:hypothetical protein
MKEPLSCLRCGKCCFVDLTAYMEKEDYERSRHQRNSALRPACLSIPGIPGIRRAGYRAGCRVKGAWIETV